MCDKIVVRLREYNNQIGYVREVKNRNAQVFLPNERRVVMVGTERGIVRVEPEAGDKVRVKISNREHLNFVNCCFFSLFDLCWLNCLLI